MPLTDAKIRAVPAGDKEQKLFDGGGLYLLIHRNGSRYWRMKFRIHGREGKLSFGLYPTVSKRKVITALRIAQSGVVGRSSDTPSPRAARSTSPLTCAARSCRS